MVAGDEWRPVRDFLAEEFPKKSLMEACEVGAESIVVLAAEDGNTEVVRLLLPFSQFSQEDMQDMTRCVAGSDDVEVMRLLMKHGAEVDFQGWIDWEILPCVGILELVKHLEPEKFVGEEGETFLGCACVDGRKEEAQWLLERGATISLSNREIYDVIAREPAIGALLLDRGISLNAPDNQGMTVLDYFVEFNRVLKCLDGVIGLLIARGARLNHCRNEELQRRIDATLRTKQCMLLLAFDQRNC